ncbi:MAG: Ig-like domain-containing protein [Candidatus Methanoperedens sp.]|nr:Ig-like domain-containing protein [Candidatus Methanoperedens sp.]
MPSFTRDERASIELPIRLVVYVILTGAIIAITAIGLSQIWPGITADSMEKQIGEIKVSLSAMQSGSARNLIDSDSPAGNIRTFKITIPEDVDYLAFGADPDPDNDHNLTNTPLDLLTEGGNVIFYSSGKGGKKRIPIDGTVELREGLLDNGRWIINNFEDKQYGTVITGKGKYELTFELVYDPISKEKYTLVHYTDDLDAFINPYDPTILPNNIWITLNPASIPADGVTNADILVKLKDKKGRDAPRDGVIINLSASLGTLSALNLTTIKGKGTASISSDIVGTSLITATSPGLNPGSAHLTITPEPIIIEFNRWLFYEDEMLGGEFSTNQDLEYTISFSGYATNFQVPFIGVWWPNASIEIDGIKMGEEMIDSESLMARTLNKTMISAGNHTFNISLKNDKYFPLLGDTNLFVEKVEIAG